MIWNETLLVNTYRFGWWWWWWWWWWWSWWQDIDGDNLYNDQLKDCGMQKKQSGVILSLSENIPFPIQLLISALIAWTMWSLHILRLDVDRSADTRLVLLPERIKKEFNSIYLYIKKNIYCQSRKIRLNDV